jgi:hypothetical protein
MVVCGGRPVVLSLPAALAARRARTPRSRAGRAVAGEGRSPTLCGVGADGVRTVALVNLPHGFGGTPAC